MFNDMKNKYFNLNCVKNENNSHFLLKLWNFKILKQKPSIYLCANKKNDWTLNYFMHFEQCFCFVSNTKRCFTQNLFIIYFWHWRTSNVTKFLLHLSSFFPRVYENIYNDRVQSVDEVTCFYNLSFFIIVPLSNYTFAYNTNRMLWARQDIFFASFQSMCQHKMCMR